MRAFYVCLLLLITSLVHAQQPGTLDKTFGRNGRLWDTLGRYPAWHLLQIQPDDKIVIGGAGFLKGSGIKTFRIERALQNGRADYAFGDSGKVLIDFHFSDKEENHSSSVTCMALQPDGKIVAGGYYSNRSGLHNSFVIVRLLPDGTIDSSFGIDGFAKPHLWGSYITGKAMTVQADGRILFGGTCEKIINDRLFFIARLLPDGSQDGSFGTKGVVIENYREADALTVQPDGKIIAGGTNGLWWEETHLLLRRYLANGTPDKSFGSGGTMDTLLAAGANSFNDMALQPDGSLLVSGNGSYLYRFKNNGTIDKQFGSNGTAVNPFPKGAFTQSTFGRKVLISGTHIYLSGNGTINTFQNASDLWLLAYKANGTLDSGFAGNGMQTADYGFEDYAGAAGLQSDGKIIVYGLTDDQAQMHQVRNLLRYYGYPVSSFVSNSEKNGLQNIPAATSLYVYPNPATDYFVISGSNTKSAFSITLTDALGKAVAVYKTSNTAQYKADVSKLATGVYYVQIRTDSKTETIRLIKK